MLQPPTAYSSGPSSIIGPYGPEISHPVGVQDECPRVIGCEARSAYSVECCPRSKTREWLRARTSDPPGYARPKGRGSYVSVDHRRADIAVSEQGLDGANVMAVFEEMCCERMTERVRGLLA